MAVRRAVRVAAEEAEALQNGGWDQEVAVERADGIELRPMRDFVDGIVLTETVEQTVVMGSLIIQATPVAPAPVALVNLLAPPPAQPVRTPAQRWFQ